jgi:glycogen phosphorylase
MSIIEGGQVHMANLAIYGSHRVNGVAELHSEILKTSVFKDFYEMYPDRFTNVTNGVTPRRWLLHINPHLAHFISKRIGKSWLVNFPHIEGLAKFAADPESQKEFLEIKKENKKNFLNYLKAHNPLRDFRGKEIGYYPTLDESALFDVQIKRMHEYKRQLMNILHAIMLYHEIKANPNARAIKRMVLFAGKAAPGYEVAKNIIHLICCVARKVNHDPEVSSKLNVIFVENYNVSRAEIIIPAADLSEQISTAGMEASGTGNMKLAMNGALTIGTEDGANIEIHREVTDAWWPFGFGKTTAENVQMRNNRSYSSWDIYMHDPQIHQAVESLRDQTFAETEAEHQAHSSLYRLLLEAQNSSIPDRYFVLSDLRSYYETQKKVEEFYLQPAKWAEYALHNMASMGKFSTDESIHNYAKKIWNIEPCPVHKSELEKVRAEYSEHDKCRIL